MPELTPVIHYQCKELSYFYMEVLSRNNLKVYQVRLGNERTWPTCTCFAYVYGKKVDFGGRKVPQPCKHIRDAERWRCSWHSQYSPELQTVPGVCPRCGKETEEVWVMV